jgi:hypothetical protein
VPGPNGWGSCWASSLSSNGRGGVSTLVLTDDHRRSLGTAADRLLKQTIARNATDDEVAVFLERCAPASTRSPADIPHLPMGWRGGREVMARRPIDGYRLVAAKHRCIAGRSPSGAARTACGPTWTAATRPLRRGRGAAAGVPTPVPRRALVGVGTVGRVRDGARS